MRTVGEVVGETIGKTIGEAVGSLDENGWRSVRRSVRLMIS